jgi:hypothetical protein
MPHSRRALLISAATVSAPVAMLSGWPSPDSEVLSVAAELEAGDDEFQRLCDAAEAATEQEAPAIDIRIQENVARHWQLRTRLARIPASTEAGWRAKARIARRFLHADGPADDSLALSLLNDLLGAETSWDESAQEKAGAVAQMEPQGT